MSYTPTVWKTGDVISSAKLNKLENGVAAKQDALTFDQSPTEGSNNPVTSGGVYTALETKANASDVSEIKNDLDDVTEIDLTNLYNKDDTSNRFIGYPNSSKQLRSSDNACTVFIPCLPNTKYTAQKMRSARFGFGYTDELPAHGVYATSITSNANADSITITTGADAEYLILFCYISTAEAEGVTLSQILDTIMIQTGETATPYVAYHQITATDLVARSTANDANALAQTAVQPNTRSSFKQVTTELMVVDSTVDSPVYSTAISPTLSDYTGTDATYADGKWTINRGGSISHSIDVVADTTYRITLVVDSINIDSGGVYVRPVTISLGTQSISIFSANDANWDVCLKAAETGTVTLTIAGSEGWGGVISGVRVLPVTTLTTRTGKLDDSVLYAHGTNVALGGGQSKTLEGTGGEGAPSDGSCGSYNTALGRYAQNALDTGMWNTAVGNSAQRNLTAGKGNTGIGRLTQHSITTGCYNNAVGESAQGSATTAQWNDALGIEAQGKMTTGSNNVAVGRRAQHLMTTGRMNTAVGAWSGFMADDVSEGDLSTITACYQTLIGCSATQSDDDTDDYLTALGYKARGTLKALALGALAKALGEESITIGYDVTATNDNEIAIGKSTHTLVLCGKIISFNQDGSVTWTPVT